MSNFDLYMRKYTSCHLSSFIQFYEISYDNQGHLKIKFKKFSPCMNQLLPSIGMISRPWVLCHVKVKVILVLFKMVVGFVTGIVVSKNKSNQLINNIVMAI